MNAGSSLYNQIDFYLMTGVIALYFLALIIMPLSRRSGRVLYFREMVSSFTTTYGYIVLILMIFFIGIMAIQAGSMMQQYANNALADAVFDARNFSFFMLLGIPLLTMRSIAAEREDNSLELLVTSPISMWTVVGSKFLSAFTLFTLGLLISVLVPFYIDMKAPMDQSGLDWASIFGVYLGLLLMGASLIASGIFISSLCARQLTAMILILIFCFIQLSMQVFYQSLTAEQEVARRFLEVISILSHVISISYSTEHALYWKDIVFLVFYTLTFLLATTFVLERRRQ